MKRIFLIVLDAFGIGEMPDAAEFGDEGSNTLCSASKSPRFCLPNLQTLGLFNIDGVSLAGAAHPKGAFGRLGEKSRGKDTTVGHWELMGEVSEKAFPTYPQGFPTEVIEQFQRAVGRGVLCNLPYSGTKVLEDYGKQHMETGNLIVYTSADSVFQIAAHEEIVPLKELYRICEIAREQLQGEHAVARVIARPFVGEPGSFVRTKGRHDYSLMPQGETVLDILQNKGLATIGVGKIYDIFAGKGISETVKTAGNTDGIQKILELMQRDFHGLCFVNLVDTDMLYGHRNDADGFAGALTEFDQAIPAMQKCLDEEDLLIITADHGCDPGTPSTDHSREYIPAVIYGRGIKTGVNLGTRTGFDWVGGTVLEALGVESPFPSLYKEIL